MVIKKLFLLFGIIFLFITILSPVAFADAEKVLFTGKTASGELKIDNTVAYVTIVEGRVRIKYLNSIIITSVGQCQQDNGIKLCVSTVEAPFSATITISAAIANLEITKTIKSQEYSVGQLITATVTVKNSGNREAENVIFKDDISNLTIINPTGCSISEDGNYLVYETSSISKSSAVSCQYTFKSFQDGELRKIAEVKYFDGLKNASSSASSIVKITPFGFNIKSSLETQKLELNKENKVWFNFSLKSTRETNVRDLTIQFPDNLIVSDDKGNILQSRKYTTKTLVQVKGYIYKIFNISVIKPNEEFIRTSIDFTADQPGLQTRDFKVIYNYEEPIIRFRDLNFTGFESANAFYLSNNNNFDIIEIQAKLSSAKLDITPKEFNEKLVSAKGELKIGEFNFKTAENKKLLPIFVDLIFKTKNNQTFQLTRSFSFYINASSNKTKSSEKNTVNTSAISALNKTANETIVMQIKKEKQIGFWCRQFGWLIESLCN